jgi:hypothetical protein
MVNILYTDLVLLLNYQISKRFYYFKRSTCKDRRDAPLARQIRYIDSFSSLCDKKDHPLCLHKSLHDFAVAHGSYWKQK